ncbi:MAG: tetratricopeptide repeat protein [Candidatus Methanofastidiosia archaeon]|jgi:tetratricopeptide (TPR) repeat protein
MVTMLDNTSKKILKTIYGFGIREINSYGENQIPPHRSSSGLRAIFSDVPKTTFYRKLKDLKEEEYILIMEKKQISRGYEIVNGEKINILRRYSKSREIKLTERGKRIVSELLLNELPRNIHVLIKEKEKNILFLDAIDYLKNMGIEMHTAFLHLLNEIEKRRFPIDLERIRKRILKEKIQYVLKTPPETPDFIGREEYMKKLRIALHEHTNISVVGLAGFGKSYLISYFYHQLENRKKFWWDFSRDSTDLNALLNTIAGFLEEYYHNALLLKYLAGTKTRDWRIIESILESILDHKALFFFDNYHMLQQKERREIWKLFKILRYPLIICSREKIREFEFTQSCEILLDAGFNKNEINKFLFNRGLSLTDSQIERIYLLTKGIPYLVDGISKIYESTSDFETLLLKGEEGSFDFIHKEVTKTLFQWEKLVLNFASVFRRNEKFSAYDHVYDGEEPVKIVLSTLVHEKKHLLQTPEATYVIHDILKEYFYENLGKNSLKYHKRAANYYLSDKTPENIIEALYHLQKAEEYKKSADTAIEYSDDIINKGFLHDFLGVLEKFDSYKVSDEKWVLLLNIVGKIHETLGNWDICLEKYEHALTISKKICFKRGEAQSRANLGSICYRKGEWNTSMEHFQAALALYEKLGYTAEKASILSEIGILHYAKSEWDTAIEYLERSLNILGTVRDKNKRAFALNVLGIIYFRKGKAEKALEFYKKALRLYETLEYTGEIAKVAGNIGLVLGSLNRWDKALQYYNRALELNKQFQERDMTAKILSEIGVLYFYMEEHDTSIGYYKESLEIFEELGNLEETAVTLDCLGISYSCKKEWEKAEEYYKKSLEIKEDLKDLYGMAVTYNNLGKMLGEKGDAKSGIYYLNKSINLKKKLKDDKGIADSLKAITDLYMQLDKEKAFEAASKAFELYKKVGLSFGMGEMYFRLGEIHEDLGENDKAIQVYKNSIELFRITKSIVNIANAYYKLGLLYKKIGENAASKLYLKKSDEIFAKLKDKNKEIETHRNCN